MAIAITQRKSYTATKNAESSGHCPNFPTHCSGLAGFRGHSSLCGLRAKIDIINAFLKEKIRFSHTKNKVKSFGRFKE